MAGAGLFVRGGFHPEPGDDVPSLPGGQLARTVLLVGNAGNDLWRAFRAARPEPAGPNPLEDWFHPLLEAAAREVGAHLLLPNRGPPYPPVQRWALRAEAVHRSPIGLLIHPDYGLWHVYRAAFLFAETLDLPALRAAPSPCESCESRPCLRVCPADAFKPDAFDAFACIGHIESPAGSNCRDRGCLARRACPVGRDHAYEAAAGAFHMAAVARAVRRMIDRGEVAADAPIPAGGPGGGDSAGAGGVGA